jgi:hypothetical protein
LAWLKQEQQGITVSQTRTETTKRRFGCATRYRSIALAVLGIICSAQLLLIAGCHRGFYRRQADAEARRLIKEKAGSRWDSATGGIEIDPMSRMFDPFSADHPPIPPDDPAAHKLMQTVDNKPGYPHWHANGDINEVENPTWQSYLPTNENGEVVLSLSDAYRLALIHSTDLQQQRETLYLSALEVSIQRFGFDTQLFSGFNSFLTSSGRFNNGTGQSSTNLTSSLGENGQGLQASRLGITGANFVVGLANTIMWEFSGNNTQSANSLINFSVIQPLLRGAGRERILESLTQAERILLANVRQLERFRRGFYLEIATGRNAGAGPSQNSGAFLNAPGLSGSNVGGYIGLLQQKQQIKNIEFGVAQFESLLIQFSELFKADRIDKLQVTQFESNVYGQQQTLLNAKIAYQSALDQFKVSIGLPQDLQIVIEDPFLDAFSLIDDRFPDQLEDIRRLRDETSKFIVEFALNIDARARLEDSDEDFDAINKALKSQTEELLPFVKRAEKLIDNILEEDRAIVSKDIAALKDSREDRLEYLSRIVDDIESGRIESRVEPKVFSAESIPTSDVLATQLDGEDNPRSLVALLDGALEEIRVSIEELEEFEKSQDDISSEDLEKLLRRIPDLLNEVNGNVLEMALLQAEARASSIGITDVEIDSGTAFETARCLRRDWMNARAALVDNWRQIEFFADQLESQVDLVLTGEIGNANADNPFRIRYEDGNLSAGFRFDAPIVRQAERNAYRQAQISYQQARRSYYQFEDSIHQSLRLTLRSINQNKVLFELVRTNLQNQIDQVKLNRANLFAPPAVGERAGQSDTTATFLAQAIQSLSGQQNAYLSQWAQYEVLRRNLDFDMGTMELDSNFEWVDPGEIDSSIGSRVAAREGVAENDRFCCGMQQSQMQYVDQYIEGEVIDSQSTDQNYSNGAEVDSVVEPPSDNVEALEYEGTDTIEIDSTPEKSAPKIRQVSPPVPIPDPPVVKPVVELSPLSTLAPAKSPVARTGFLDPFRRDISVRSNQRRLVAEKPSLGEINPWDTSGDSSLKRAFEPKVEEISKPVKSAAKAQATILRR